MKTAAYTICKNEINRIDQWIYYTKDFTGRYVLDTGSTDGTWEKLLNASNIEAIQMPSDPETFDYSYFRNINLGMIPKDIDWCLSPDIDEYFSINVLKEIEKTERKHPNVTNIACTRLDIYSEKVFCGQPHSIGTNKIHRRNLYDWKQPVYEHLSYIGPGNEVEIYNTEIFLIHDQEVDKPRSSFYPMLMKREYAKNPQNDWNNWFLANHYFMEQDLENFVDVGMNMIRYYKKPDEKYYEVLNSLIQISRATNVDETIRNKLTEFLTIARQF